MSIRMLLRKWLGVEELDQAMGQTDAFLQDVMMEVDEISTALISLSHHAGPKAFCRLCGQNKPQWQIGRAWPIIVKGGDHYYICAECYHRAHPRPGRPDALSGGGSAVVD